MRAEARTPKRTLDWRSAWGYAYPMQRTCAQSGRGRNRRGFILFFGTRSIVKNEPQAPVRTRCPKCEQEADLIAKSHRQWFTLFFVPVFPISGKMNFT